MPIVAKSVLDARRAAAAARSNPFSEKPTAAAIPQKTVPIGKRGSAEGVDLPSATQSAKRRGHAVKDENGKWQPTGDYPEGFARTPEHTRFKPGCKGGPGRPKGSVSHDALLAKHLLQKREVSLNGRRRQYTARELLVMTTVKSALEGKDKHARAYVLAQDQRLHPSRDSGDDAMSLPALTASDLLSLAEYQEEMRERIRAELMAELEAGRREKQ